MIRDCEERRSNRRIDVLANPITKLGLCKPHVASRRILVYNTAPWSRINLKFMRRLFNTSFNMKL